jgi:predicted nucleotidyltransferase
MVDSVVHTALDLPVEERKLYDPANAIRKRQITTRKELSDRRQRALKVAQQAANLLRETYKAQRVVIFGSLARGDGFTLWSDIDLAVWGVPPDQFYAAVAVVTGLSAEFKIDLVDPDFCRPILLDFIDHEGIEI